MIKKIYWFLFVYDLDRSFSGPAIAPGHDNGKSRLFKDVAHIMLFAYLLFIFNSAIPVFADVLAHTFWEKEHLASVHHLQGNDHLHKQVSNAEKRSENNKSPNAKPSAESHVPSEFSIVFKPVNFDPKTNHCTLFKCFFPSHHPDSEYPPPQVSFRL